MCRRLVTRRSRLISIAHWNVRAMYDRGLEFYSQNWQTRLLQFFSLAFPPVARHNLMNWQAFERCDTRNARNASESCSPLDTQRANRADDYNNFPSSPSEELHNLIKLKNHCAPKLQQQSKSNFIDLNIFSYVLLFDFVAETGEKYQKRDCMTVNYNRNGKEKHKLYFSFTREATKQFFCFDFYLFTFILEGKHRNTTFFSSGKKEHKVNSFLKVEFVYYFIILGHFLPWVLSKGQADDWIFFTSFKPRI